MKREFHLERDELEDLEDLELEELLVLELEELEELSAIELDLELDLEELTERRHRLEVALERVKAAIKQRLEEG